MINDILSNIVYTSIVKEIDNYMGLIGFMPGSCRNNEVRVIEWLDFGCLCGRYHGPARITYHDIYRKEEWLYQDQLHRISGPAFIDYIDGKIMMNMWYNNDNLHRVHGPAVIKYYNNGQKSVEEWYQHDKLYRVVGPSIVEYYPNGSKKIEIWREGDVMVRTDGPAIIRYAEDESMIEAEWYIKRNLHRLIRYKNGQVIEEQLHKNLDLNEYKLTTYINGKIMQEKWYCCDQLHNDTGPALIEYDNEGYITHQQYYFYGSETMK